MRHDLIDYLQWKGFDAIGCEGTADDRIHGLQQGADAYLVIGVSLELIEATCHSVLRRLMPAPNAAQSVAASEPLGLWQLDLLRSELVAPLGQAVERGGILALLGKPNNPNNVRNLDNCATPYSKW